MQANAHEKYSGQVFTDIEHPAGVFPEDRGQVFRILISDFCQFQQNGFHKCRLIPPHTVFLGRRRQVGSIGFNQKPIFGDERHKLPQCRTPLLNGEDAGDADAQPEFQILLHFGLVSAEAMHHAFYAIFKVGLQHLKEAALAVSFVENHW